MTDKEVIIDGINVGRCRFFEIDADDRDAVMMCEVENALGFLEIECQKNPNCYYKQLQRQEQKLEISQHYINELTKYILEIGDSFQIPSKMTILGKNCIEYYAILSASIKSYIKDLQTENEELKKKANCYNCGTCNGKEDYINMKRHCENAINSLHKEQKQTDTYKQALEEIKGIIEHIWCDCHGECEEYIEIGLQQIIQKINEVLKGE